jgi:hypothetical protein
MQAESKLHDEVVEVYKAVKLLCAQYHVGPVEMRSWMEAINAFDQYGHGFISTEQVTRLVSSQLSSSVLSCPVLSCPVLSCPVLSCPVLALLVVGLSQISSSSLSTPAVTRCIVACPCVHVYESHFLVSPLAGRWST